MSNMWSKQDEFGIFLLLSRVVERKENAEYLTLKFAYLLLEQGQIFPEQKTSKTIVVRHTYRITTKNSQGKKERKIFFFNGFTLELE